MASCRLADCLPQMTVFPHESRLSFRDVLNRVCTATVPTLEFGGECPAFRNEVGRHILRWAAEDHRPLVFELAGERKRSEGAPGIVPP